MLIPLKAGNIILDHLFHLVFDGWDFGFYCPFIKILFKNQFHFHRNLVKLILESTSEKMCQLRIFKSSSQNLKKEGS